MAKVYRCDMCGKIDEGVVGFRTRHEFFNVFDICVKSYDLCDKCAREVIEFIENCKIRELMGGKE
ncbi:MAG: hypothetical protein IKE20_03140 [Eggerthellaceae bacterium]|nr:hypothetical protein [Eggerthellaceae bacterium]